MEAYYGLDIRELLEIGELLEKDISCWILYQIAEESGVDIRLDFFGSRVIIKNAILESLHCILYKSGEYYQLKNLMEQLNLYLNSIDINQMLIKEGIDAEVSANFASFATLWDTVLNGNTDKEAEIIVNNNGFCIFYPISTGSFGEEVRPVKVGYCPNSKKLKKGVLNGIWCEIDLIEARKEEFDYRSYFMKTLEDSQMVLSEEESLELYHILSGRLMDNYFLDCGELHFKDIVIYDIEEEKDQLYYQDKYYQGKPLKIKRKTAEDLFVWWINGDFKKKLDRAVVMGLVN